MKFYLDCEFNDMGERIDLMSIAVVCENGDSIHLLMEYDKGLSSEWLQAHVEPHFAGMRPRTTKEARDAIGIFMTKCLGGASAEFWGYYCAHDWYLLCRLFGGMMQLPTRWGMYCREMMQLPFSEMFNCSDDIQEKNHCALFDAQWMRDKHAEVLGQPKIFGLFE